MALLVGLLTFMENLSGWDFGVDQLLAVEMPGAMAVASPNRMGLPASLSFTLIGLTLLILSRRDHRAVRVVQALALAVCVIALLPTIRLSLRCGGVLRDRPIYRNRLAHGGLAAPAGAGLAVRLARPKD